ncbi:recombinase family protein [Salana multivorans]
MGRPAKGVRPVGYSVAGEVVPDEAETVRWVFEQFAAGDTLKGLAAQLEARGVPTRRGGCWSSSTVSTMLRNPRYAGRSVYPEKDPKTGKVTRRTVAEGQWVALVTGDLFDAVQARLDDPRRTVNRHDTARKHVGSGLYRCECGLPVRSSSGLGPGRHRYVCKEAHYYRNGQPVDDYVAAVVRERLGRADLKELLVRPEDASALSALVADESRLRQRLARTEADYDADLIDGRRYKEKAAKISAELDQVARRRTALVVHGRQGAAVLAADDPVAAFDAASLGLRQRTIDLLAEVTLLPGVRGRKVVRNGVVDPDGVAVHIAWRA